jgi:diguanylate cyclase (GGDEF)-like protein/PAS domain S-box-containing protein
MGTEAMELDNNIIDLASERRRRGPRFNGGLMDILEVSRDLVCLCRAGAITAINGAGARLLGAKTTEELLGRSMAEFLIPEYGRVLDLFLAGMASEDKSVPTRIIALDRTIRDVELQVYRAREVASDATVVMCRDISHEGRLADNAEESRQRFHQLVDNAINLVCHVVDDSIRYINRAGVELLGADGAEAVLGRPLKDIFHGDYAELFEAGLVATIVEENALVPLRLCRADGTGLDAMVKITRLPSHRGVELMVEARDITAHNRAVITLRHANETLEVRVIERTRELAAQRRLADEHRQVAEASRRFTESLIDTIPSPVWFRDARGDLQMSNRAFRQMFGCDPATGDACHLTVRDVMPAEDERTDAELLAGDRVQASFETSVAAVDGMMVEGLVLKSAYHDDDGRVVGIIAVMADISERKTMELELRRLATTDPLTGAANRRHFMSAAEIELERSVRYGHQMSVVMLDIDHFKKVNDRYGHAGGDDALKATVAACYDTLREVDLVGRIGGEEFAILLPETDAAGALEMAERLRARIATIRVAATDDAVITFTASLGTAGRDSETTIDSLLARADQALYRAKAEGRNRVLAG